MYAFAAVVVYWYSYELSSLTEKFMSPHPGSALNEAGSAEHLPTLPAVPGTATVPPMPPQQSRPGASGALAGSLAPATEVYADRSPNSVFCFLPIALSCSPASVARDFFM